MRIWALLAAINICIALFCIGCFRFTVIVTPDRDQKNISETAAETTVNYNNVPKIEFKNEGSKPVGQVQNFGGINPDDVPTIKELGPE